MAIFNSSSLAFSDHNGMRHRSGLLRNTKDRISKQHLVEHKMFRSRRGSTGRDLKIGRKFRKGKSTKLEPDMKSSAISPSIEEFDKMMNDVVKKGSNKKKFTPSRKLFG